MEARFVKASQIRKHLVAAQAADQDRLDFCVHYFDRDLELHEQGQARLSLIRATRECAEDGKVVLVYNSRDCDQVIGYNNKITLPADWATVRDAIEGIYEHAEGPIWGLTITSLSAAALLVNRNEDRALQAFENGNSYRCY
jgi:hypothetical protein